MTALKPIHQMSDTEIRIETLHKLLDTFDAQQMPPINTAIRFAHRMHEGQTRIESENVDYVIHLMRVTLRLLRWGVKDPDVLIAALCHDVLEDCALRITEHLDDPDADPLIVLHEMFADRAVQMIQHLTRDPARRFQPYHLWIEELTQQADLQTTLIKTADICDNAGLLYGQSSSSADQNQTARRQRKYFSAIDPLLRSIRAHHRIALRSDDHQQERLCNEALADLHQLHDELALCGKDPR